jgi:hypothetical protein
MTVSTQDYIFGPPSAQSFGGVALGQGDQPAKVTIKETTAEFRPQGAAAPIAGLTRLLQCAASAIVTLNEFSLANLQMILHNVTAVVGTATVTSPSGLATTLTADAAAGATSIALTAATNVVAGTYLELTRVIAGPEIILVAATYTTGLTIPLTTPLIRNHQSGEAVVMVNDAGTTILRQRTGMISAAQHKNFVFQAVGPDGNVALITIWNARSDGNLEVTLGEATPAGTPVTFTGFASKTDPTLAPWSWERLTAI